MRRSEFGLALLAFAVAGCIGSQGGTSSAGREPVVGGPCEDCEAIFQGQPERPSSSTRIAPEGEPGEPMRIEGLVLDPSGKPAAGVIVYVHHTNAQGLYPPDARWEGHMAHRHGLLRGWARTGEDGRYRFDTIRPAGYPGQDIPAHVHMHLLEPGRCTYWIEDLLFDDDPRLTPARRAQAERGRGGNGVARPAREADGTWRVERPIFLGLGIADYP